MTDSPEGVENSLGQRWDTFSRRFNRFLRTTPLLKGWRVEQAVNAEEVVGDLVTNLQILEPADPAVSLHSAPHDEPFLEVCKYFHNGFYTRPAIFTCEVPHAYCHIETGLICGPDFRALNDSQMTYRMILAKPRVGNTLYRPFQWFKPLQVQRLPGLYTTISNVYVKSWGHWIFDCLPRMYSLEKASAGRPVTLLISDSLSPSWYESLDAILPPHFTVLRLPKNSWVQVDNMLLASYPSGRANSHMPPQFLDYVRKNSFIKFGLPVENQPSQRIYVSRAMTRHRRLLNEPGVVDLLSRFGFTSVALETLTFREQVELFHRAESIISVDGSNWGDMIFAGKIKICVFYSDQQPNTHWFTAAKGLGQEHFFLAGSESSPHADFTIDLKALEQVLTEQMQLRPRD